MDKTKERILHTSQPEAERGVVGSVVNWRNLSSAETIKEGEKMLAEELSAKISFGEKTGKGSGVKEGKIDDGVFREDRNGSPEVVNMSSDMALRRRTEKLKSMRCKSLKMLKTKYHDSKGKRRRLDIGFRPGCQKIAELQLWHVCRTRRKREERKMVS